MKKEKLYLYYDLDNTGVRFCKNKEDEKVVVKEKMHLEGYYRNLPVIDNFVEALKKLYDDNEHEVFILSSCIDTPYCKKEKLEFLAENLPFIKKENLILINTGENKVSFIKTPLNRSLLIDDFRLNLQQWEEEGGIAVKKRDSDKDGYKYIVRDHFDIFDIIKDIQRNLGGEEVC